RAIDRAQKEEEAEIHSLEEAAKKSGDRQALREIQRGGKNIQKQISVMQYDFINALQEVKPKFGLDLGLLEQIDIKEDVIDYGKRWIELMKKIGTSAKPGFVHGTHATLLVGRRGCGKTTLAAYAALLSGYPFVRMLSRSWLARQSSSAIALDHALQLVFEEAERSELALIIIDDFDVFLQFDSDGSYNKSFAWKLLG
ncbi:MAG: hypothetical protein EZS28_053778, partial [Streblomastix strix]